MLRRSVAALFAVAAAGLLASCGIKGPLKLPPAQPPASSPAGAPASPPASPDGAAPESPVAPGEKKP